jgi:homoserine O-acetyltransferase/O-succinyltransferase
LLVIPASEETRGHGTTGSAKFYAKQLAEFLEAVPRKASGRSTASTSPAPSNSK